MKAARYVIIHSQVYRWEEKAPFVKSGRSIHGGLEYDRESDTVRCHECGAWLKSLGSHISRTHGMSGREYRIVHGLRTEAGLNSAGNRAALQENIGRVNSRHHHVVSMEHMAAMRRARGQSRPAATGLAEGIRLAPAPGSKAETMNQRGMCAAQLVAKVAAIGKELGHTPSQRQSGTAWGTVRSLFGSYRALCQAAGLEANLPLKGPMGDAILIEMLRDFYVLNGRLPGKKDWGTGSLPGGSVYDKRFGSRLKAYRAAGLAHVALSDPRRSWAGRLEELSA